MTLWSVGKSCDIFDDGKSYYMVASSKVPEVFFDHLTKLIEKHCSAHVEMLYVYFKLP